LSESHGCFDALCLGASLTPCRLKNFRMVRRIGLTRLPPGIKAPRLALPSQARAALEWLAKGQWYGVPRK
jgi:hypothetical protein